MLVSSASFGSAKANDPKIPKWVRVVVVTMRNYFLCHLDSECLKLSAAASS